MSILYLVSYLEKLFNGKDTEQLLQMKSGAALAVAAVSCRRAVFPVEMFSFVIVALQLCGPPSPPCSGAVIGVTFPLLFATAGLFCNCSSTVELEVISHHHPMFTIFKCNFFSLSPASRSHLSPYLLSEQLSTQQ